MQSDISHDQRQEAADRLMKHLLQKGRPAPYKERLINGFANPSAGRMPEALIPITGKRPLGILQRLVFAAESWIRDRSNPKQPKLPDGSRQTIR